jgi:hypothetical protein
MAVLRDTVPTSDESRGQHRGKRDYSLFFLRTMRYSLRRALSLDSVDGCTHNPTIRSNHRFFKFIYVDGWPM